VSVSSGATLPRKQIKGSEYAFLQLLEEAASSERELVVPREHSALVMARLIQPRHKLWRPDKGRGRIFYLIHDGLAAEALQIFGLVEISGVSFVDFQEVSRRALHDFAAEVDLNMRPLHQVVNVAIQLAIPIKTGRE